MTSYHYNGNNAEFNIAIKETKKTKSSKKSWKKNYAQNDNKPVYMHNLSGLTKATVNPLNPTCLRQTQTYVVLLQ